MRDRGRSEHEEELKTMTVAKHLSKLRICLVCHEESTDEICCTCERATVPVYPNA